MQRTPDRHPRAANLTESERSTFDRIEGHAFNVPGDSLTFSARLARENAWSADYTAAVISEYRRFCFLAVHAGHPVTPSDQVDQAWHLHLTHTHDYWARFCPDVLGTSLHHGPTRGGHQEAAKYQNWYAQTLDSYERCFGPPRADVWPPPAARFRNAEQFVRINRADRLTLSRTGVHCSGLMLGGTGLLAAAAGAFAADGGSFPLALIFVVVIIVGGVLLFTIARTARGTSQKQSGCGFVGAPTGSGGKSGKGGRDADSADGSGTGDGGGGAGCGGCGS